MELATLAETDLSLFSGDNGSVKDEMLDMLSLSGPIDFPIRRLVTLWKNTKWKAAITEWCCTSLGRDTFNVSLWDEMARLRIDDVSLQVTALGLHSLIYQYWFDTFNKVLKVISQIGREISNYISLADWNVLVGLKSPRSKTEIQSTFFPGASADVLSDLESKGSSSRRKNFLVSFDDSAYYAIYTAVSESPDLPFLNIQTFLRTSREHGRIFSQVIFHIGQWLNPSIYAVGDRENNKPQQWRNFLPAFEDSNGNESEESARSLQRHIFATFCNRLDELARGPGSSYLSDTDADEDDYLDRFSCPIWRDLLIEVYRIVGGRFQRSLAKFNTYDPYALPQQWLPPMERLRESIRCLPDIKSHPRLCQPSALDALMAFLRTWMVEHAEVVPGVVGHTDEPKTQVQEQDTQVGQHCCIIDTVDRDDTRPPSNTSPIEVSGTISGSAASEKYDGESVLDDLEYDSQARDKSRPNVIEDRDAQLDSTVPPTISKPSSIATFSLDDMLPSPADLEKLHVRHRQHRQHRPTIYSTEDTTNLEVAKPIQAQIDPLIPGQSQGKGSRRKLPDWRKRPAAVSMAPRM